MYTKLASFIAVSSLAACGTTVERPATANMDPSKLSYVRIYCTPDNESHFDTVTLDLGKVDAAPPALPFYAKGSPATRVAFAAFDAGWGAEDEAARKYHPAPAAQYVVYLRGQMSVSTSDGQRRTFGAGDVLRVEDARHARDTSALQDPQSFTPWWFAKAVAPSASAGTPPSTFTRRG